MRSAPLVFVLLTACSTQTIPMFDDAAIDAGRDAGFDGGRDASIDAPFDSGRDGGADGGVDAGDQCSTSCGPAELCGELGDGNGIDEDCDDRVDEDCACMPGTARSCFPGPAERRDVGTCADGVMFCTEFGRYGDCVDGQLAEDEVCDGADNDCDGTTDDGLVGCATGLSCPGSERATPLRPYALEGSRIDMGTAIAWQWTVTCPDTVPTCPLPADPTARDTSIFLISSGNYRVRLEVELTDGSSNACEWVVYVRGEGLRVELTWDTQGLGRGDTDVDLHLHRRSVAPGTTTGETDFFSADDCFYLRCKASTYDYDESALRTRWSLPDTTDLSQCDNAPQGEGALWTSRGACYNPRLDVDVINCDPAVTDPQSPGFCAPENINIDDPPLGEPYRIWVHYFNDHGFAGDTHPQVDVYCYGERRASFGSDPFITFDFGDEDVPGRMHDSWIVADVVFYVDSCGRPQCRVAPIHEVRNDALFGPPWSF